MGVAGRRGPRVAMLGRALPLTRGARFARAVAGNRVTYADLAAVPAWLTLPEPARAQAACLAALLHHRPAIDRELSGERLRGWATAAGEAVFDAACGAELDPELTTPEPAPEPAALAAAGAAILERALPVALASVHPAACNDPHARRLARLAVALMPTAVPA